jgi:hypothetical protein
VREFFSFPNPVNEVAARSVAGGVLLLAGGTLGLSLVAGPGWLWLTAVLAYGFLARVLTGPTMSPLGQFAVRVLAPRIGHQNLVPGPPKRFAQGMGCVMSVAATVLYFGYRRDGAAEILLALIIAAATLESAFAYCLGCKVFAVLMRFGVIPAETCAACADVSLRLPAPPPTQDTVHDRVRQAHWRGGQRS